MTSDRQLSVFDLLGDDGPNESLQESPKHEAHVAFAIEGLGKVETETPVHSPRQHGRMFSYSSSSPLEVARQRQSSKNFDDLLYDLELDVVSLVPIVDGNFLHEDCDITWNGSLLEIDESSSEFWNLGSHEMSDFALGGPHFEKMVTEKARGRFNISDRTWNQRVGRDCDLRDITNKPAWSCHLTEDAGESLSLLSEESCSSSAGRPQDLFPVEGSQGDAEFLHVPVEVSVAKDGENRYGKQQSGCAKVELQNDICMESNDLSSENGQSLEASESKDNCSDCKEAWDLIPEMENQKADGSTAHAEEISSFVKIGHKFDDIIDEKAYHNDVQTSLLQQFVLFNPTF
ncbi:hypothetical protein RHMOL_Rhmol01G0328800 [Rhododendron molle]|uniref:Uncharacterized protein n=1 Tax=Rhododendron molle TaxID=49168 RepID=A0ACC0Q8N9_RHOML|nr:hypothetical protein RHMOL_Rhmol01G0328800 [Rhododendron molle]